jgi:hypothetical protein
MSMNASYNDIVPDNLQAELIQIGADSSNGCWRIGDITITVLESVRLNQSGATAQEVFSAVGAFCGKSARTVREYAYLAGEYHQRDRDEFQTLSIDHFRVASRLETGVRYTALSWAEAQVETLGRPATVDAMQAAFGDGGEQPQEMIWDNPIVKVLHWCTGIRETVGGMTLPAGSQVTIDGAVTVIEQELQRLQVVEE